MGKEDTGLFDNYDWRIHQVLQAGDDWIVVGHLTVPGFGTRSGMARSSVLHDAVEIARENAVECISYRPEVRPAPAPEQFAATPAPQAAVHRDPPPRTAAPAAPESAEARRAAWKNITSHELWPIENPNTPDGRSASLLFLSETMGSSKRSFSEVSATDLAFAMAGMILDGNTLRDEFAATAARLFGVRVDDRIEFVRTALADRSVQGFQLTITQWQRVVAAIREKDAAVSGTLALD